MVTSTSNEWPLDTQIGKISSAGLSIPCKIRMKFFTADQSLIIKRLGTLDKSDAANFRANLNLLFGR